MKIESYRKPQSSFLSMEKDMGIIAELILKNKRLAKLLYYTTPDALKKPNLTDEQLYGLFGSSIKLTPKILINPEVLNYLTIGFDNFLPNETNPEFRDNLIVFNILCHLDNWELQDFELRPYRIAAELDSMLDKQKLTGIGEMHFIAATSIPIEDAEYGGIMLVYKAIHGGEDKKFMPNPANDEQFIKEFNEMFNS